MAAPITSSAHLFASTLQKCDIWFNDILLELGWPDDKQKAYHCLLSVLRALRDRLRPEDAVNFAQQLPLIIR